MLHITLAERARGRRLECFSLVSPLARFQSVCGLYVATLSIETNITMVKGHSSKQAKVFPFHYLNCICFFGTIYFAHRYDFMLLHQYDFSAFQDMQLGC